MNQHFAATAEAADRPTRAEAAEDVVRLVDLKRRFGATPALDGVSLTVRKGEILGIIGRSGAGKSTLIRCLNGLERPDSGEVFIEGREISRLGERELQPLRRRIGMIFQHFNLLSAKTVEDNVALPLKIEGRPKAERLARAAELLDLVGLSEKAKAYPSSLSGGQKQRVGIARALAARPALLLSDEATSALDPETTRSILALLKDINRQLGLTILLITHEMEVIRSIADRVAVIDAGRIVEEGPVWSVFADPRSEITQQPARRHPAATAGRDRRPAGADRPATRRSCRIDVAGEAARGPLLSDLAAAVPGSFRLVHGGIDHVQQQPVGTLFLAVPGSDASHLREVIAFPEGPRARGWRCLAMSPILFELLLRSIWETVLMTAASGLISLVFGLPLGLALVATDRGGIAESLWVNRALGAVINGFRSVPFIILLVALIPVTRLIVGTSIGTWAAIVPLSIAATPYYARIAEVSLREVDHGLIEAARAMGGNRWTIIREVLVPEALPGIVAGFTVTLVTLIGASAMAGAIGAGGLGDLAIRYGYQRFETSVMVAVVIVLIILVCGIQWAATGWWPGWIGGGEEWPAVSTA